VVDQAEVVGGGEPRQARCVWWQVCAGRQVAAVVVAGQVVAGGAAGECRAGAWQAPAEPRSGGSVGRVNQNPERAGIGSAGAAGQAQNRQVAPSGGSVTQAPQVAGRWRRRQAGRQTQARQNRGSSAGAVVGCRWCGGSISGGRQAGGGRCVRSRHACAAAGVIQAAQCNAGRQKAAWQGRHNQVRAGIQCSVRAGGRRW